MAIKGFVLIANKENIVYFINLTFGTPRLCLAGMHSELVSSPIWDQPFLYELNIAPTRAVQTNG